MQQGIQQGKELAMREGLLTVIELGLHLKFGVPGLNLMPRISQIQDFGRLKAIKEALPTVKAVEELMLLLMISDNGRIAKEIFMRLGKHPRYVISI